MQDASTVGRIRREYRAVRAELDERRRRQWAAAEAREHGWGGVVAAARATGLSRTTIAAGLRELDLPARQRAIAATRVRRPGAGRQSLVQTDPGLQAALEALLEPATRGDPESPLRWTCKSTRRLAEELTRQRHPVSVYTVAALLHQAGYSLQTNRKTREGASHPNRNAQFVHVNAQVSRFLDRGQPTISVDTKKKELVGDFKNTGREWRPAGRPDEVRVHDFIDKQLGKAIPYGVYDLKHDEGWGSVGIDHDTARFAAAAIGRWWNKMGRSRYPKAKQILITADGGGSNASRSRLWKVALQELADDLGLSIAVCHFPPGTSKWNAIEHRMFSHITMNWRGRPLVSHEVILNLIAHTTTRAGLKVRAVLDRRRYQPGEKITDAQLGQLCLKPDKFHGDWNYRITPRSDK